VKQTTDKSHPGEVQEFPRPPLKGSDLIRPIRNLQALAAEAKEQDAGHIVAYSAHVFAGQLYLYSVLVPERATLCISRWGERQPWRVVSLKARGWLPVQSETMETVNAWHSAARAERRCGWNGSVKVIRL